MEYLRFSARSGPRSSTVITRCSLPLSISALEDQQHRGAFAGQLQVGVHPGFSASSGLLTCRRSCRVQVALSTLGRRVHLLMRKVLPGGGNLNAELRGVFNQPGDGFRDRHADPHRIHALNFRHHVIFGDVHSGAQIEGGNNAIDRCFE